MGTVSIRIDNVSVDAEAGATLLQAALASHIYIPHLCSHPDLPPFDAVDPTDIVFRGTERIESVQGDEGRAPYEGCGLCVIEVRGEDEFIRACNTRVREGMCVTTQSARLKTGRQEKLASILITHPHACLTCAQREGCSLTQCSSNVPEEERCCEKFNRCELRKVAEYVGIPTDLPRYEYRGLTKVVDNPLFERDDNLCIGCTRCVRVCEHVYGEAAIGYVRCDVGIVLGALGNSPVESGGRLGGACWGRCPEGALKEKGVQWASWEADLVPCQSRCPVELNVQEYTRRIALGDFNGAARVNRAKTPFASILGMVCFHPCEDVCRRGHVSDPMAICALKRFAMEQDIDRSADGTPPVEPSGKRVAVIGSGPAGLTAAYYLAHRGHAVVVFETMDKPGGMLRYGIPGYRIPSEVISKDIDEILSNELVEIRAGMPVGGSIAYAELVDRGFDAVLIAVGTQWAKTLTIDGARSEGVRQGIDFLREVAEGDIGDMPFGEKKVVVIGGGDVAIDAARTAARLGAATVDLCCLESRDEMPAHGKELSDAEAEGVRVHPSWGPDRILSDDGRVKGLEVKRCMAVFDEQGRFKPSFDKDVRETFEADEIIVAIGQAPDLSFLGNSRENLVSGSLVKASFETMQTPAKGIFAAGDAVSGPTSVVDAIASGKRAAASIDRFLGGDGIVNGWDESMVSVEKTGRIRGFVDLPRVPMSHLDPDSRTGGFQVVELGYEPEEAMAEARRCLGCDLRFGLSKVVLPPERGLEFCDANVDAVPETEGVFQLLDENKEVINIIGTQNLKLSLREKLQADPSARYFLFEEDPMYTKRESELIQQYLQEHGKMPGGSEDDLDDLF